MRTGGNLSHLDVVEIDVVRRCATAVHQNGDESGAGGSGQGQVKAVPLRAVCSGHGLYQCESVDIGRVGHNTDLDHTCVGVAAFLGPELELQRVDAVLKLGQAEPTAGRSAVAIVIERLRTRVGIGGAGIGVVHRIEAAAAQVATAPAGSQRNTRACGGNVLKAVGERKRCVRNRHTICQSRHRGGEGVVSANGHYADVIVRGRRQTGDSGTGGGERSGRCPAKGALHTVFHIPRSLLITGNPRHRHLGGLHAVHHHRRRRTGCECRTVGTSNGDIGTVVAAAAGGYRGGIGTVQRVAVLILVHSAVHARRGGRTETVETRTRMRCTAGLVHRSGDTQVAVSIPLKGNVKVIGHRT